MRQVHAQRPEKDAEGNKKALRRAIESKKPDPHERALERIGYYKAVKRIRLGKDPLGPWPPPYPKWDLHDELTVQLSGVNEWNVLNWFVQLSRKGNMAELSPAEMLALQEESQALQAKGIPELTKHGAGLNEPLSGAELAELQIKVSKHIEKFITTGTFAFTDFRPTLLIERDPEDNRRLIEYEFLPPFHGNGLLYLFATLLRRVRLPIERCPYPRCQTIFLKTRKDSGYCSRECQNAHYVQRKRSKLPPGKRGRPRKSLDQGTIEKPTGKKGAKKR